MEGHPDNVTPSLMGGFVASCKTVGGEYAVTQIPISKEIKVCFVAFKIMVFEKFFSPSYSSSPYYRL